MIIHLIYNPSTVPGRKHTQTCKSIFKFFFYSDTCEHLATGVDNMYTYKYIQNILLLMIAIIQNTVKMVNHFTVIRLLV